jgi:hypothetical protein
MTKLAPRYGLSDNGLRKVCVSLEIPVPPRGYWAKLAAGHKVKRIALPPHAKRTAAVAHPASREPERPYRSDDDDRWLAERLQREGDDALKIVIDPAPSRWHPELQAVRAKLQAASVALEKSKREYDREQAHTAKNRRAGYTPSSVAMAWAYAAHSGGVLLDTHRASPLRVTSETWRATMALVNVVFFAADKRGVTPTLDEKEGRFVLTLEKESVYFAVRERFEDAWRDRLNSWSGKTEKEKYTQGTGRLFIAFYRNGWDYRQYAADQSGDFGDLSAILFQVLYRKIVAARESAREQAEKERQQEIRRQELLEIESQQAAEKARQKEQERLAELRRRREAALLAEARTWNDVELLRRYIAARRAAGTETSPEWLAWASDAADRLDPMKRSHTGANGCEYDE